MIFFGGGLEGAGGGGGYINVINKCWRSLCYSSSLCTSCLRSLMDLLCYPMFYSIFVAFMLKS